MTSRVAPAALAALLLCPVPAAAEPPAPPAGVLTVRGSATVKQKPDLAHLTLSVVTSGPTSGGTARDHAARVARAAAALASWTAEGASVDQGGFVLDQEPVQPPEDGPAGKAAVVYRAETRFDVTVTALDRLDVLLAGIAGSGLFEIGPTRYDVADEAASLDRVRRDAMGDARHQAEIYAEAGGLRLDGIERIADGEASGPGGPPVMAMRMAKAATVGVAPPKTLTFQGAVSVTWRVVPR